MVSTIGNYKCYEYSKESPSKRHELTTALNGYSDKFLEGYKSKGKGKSQLFASYHDKISDILKHGENSSDKSGNMTRNHSLNAKLLNDRRSFYDNYIEASNRDDSNEYKFSNNNKPLYKSEKLIQIEHETVKTPEPDSKNQDRDDFDDLIDLTHRIPKKVFKKINLIESNSVSRPNSNSQAQQQYQQDSNQNQRTNNKINNNINQLNSTTVQNEANKKSNLPPLPYSFLNLGDNSKQPVTQQTSQKADIATQPKQTTRIIIPVLVSNQKPTNQTELQLNRKSFSKPTSYFNNNTTHSYRDYRQHSSINLHQVSPPQQKPQTTATTYNVSSLPRQQYSTVQTGSRALPVNHYHQQKQQQQHPSKLIKSQDRINKPDMFNRGIKKPQVVYTPTFGSSQASRPKKQALNRSKSIEVNKEWDQISKIFDSLETLLNDVVEQQQSTTKKTTPSSTPPTTRIPSPKPNQVRSIPSTPTISQQSSSTRIRNDSGSSAGFKLPSSTSTSSNINLEYHAEPVNLKVDSAIYTRQSPITGSKEPVRTRITDSDITLTPQSPDPLTSYLNAKNLKQKEICDFLSRINLIKYKDVFLTNGYDDVNFINGVMDLQDLLQIGIESYDDAFKVLQEIKYLPATIKRMECDNFYKIDDWLSYLNLTEYSTSFTENNLTYVTDLKSLWEIELTTVLRIPNRGHRRRLAASMEAFSTKQQLRETKQQSNQKQEQQTLESLSSSSYSSSSFNTLCNTSTSYKLLPAKIDLKSAIENMVSLPTKTKVTFTESTKSKDPDQKTTSDDSNDENASNESTNSNSSPELSGDSSIVNFVEKPATKTTTIIAKNFQKNEDKKSEIPLIACGSPSHAEQSEQETTDSSKTNNKGIQALTQSSYTSYFSNLKKTNYDDRKSPKLIWKSDPKNLIRNSANFLVQYLGSSALIKTNPDQDPVKQTIDRLKSTAKSTPYQLPKVELAVSIRGVKLLNCKTKELMWNHDIKHINNVCQDQDELNYFAFSTQTEPSAYYYCHVFACKDKELSTQIILTVGQAFDLAYELFCKNNMN